MSFTNFSWPLVFMLCIILLAGCGGGPDKATSENKDTATTEAANKQADTPEEMPNPEASEGTQNTELPPLPAANEPKNIEFYYKVLKAKGIIATGMTKEGGKEEITFLKKDLANGYLSFSIPFSDFGYAEMTVWTKRKNGKDLVALAHGGCGPACSLGDPRFFEFEGLEFKEVTQDVFPNPAVQAYRSVQEKMQEKYCEASGSSSSPTGFLLPMKGLNIELVVYCPDFGRPSQYKKIGTLVYQDTQFVFQKN
ncbi:MAG: hypothetical protein HC913_14175 [Microscillaceae bacterium]|nr:hypothetical protein [Microscillaceae bacterium]